MLLCVHLIIVLLVCSLFSALQSAFVCLLQMRAMVSFNLNLISVDFDFDLHKGQILSDRVEQRQSEGKVVVQKDTGDRGQSAKGWLEVTFTAPSSAKPG